LPLQGNAERGKRSQRFAVVRAVGWRRAQRFDMARAANRREDKFERSRNLFSLSAFAESAERMERGPGRGAS
jgi:hypothetical protein